MLKAPSTQSTNTIDQPENIVPVETALQNAGSELHYTAPPYSIQVLQVDEK
jgi:alpha-L-arabinofuranosidase